MPIYEYRCDQCGSQFEKLVRGSSPAVSCPDCGTDKLDRQHSTFAAQMGRGGAQSSVPAGGCGSAMCGTPGYCSRS